MSIYFLGPWLADNTYKHAQKLILLSIANCVNEKGVGFISHSMICETANVSEEYVRQSVKRFIADEVLEILEPPARGRATVYRLSLPVSAGEHLSDGKDGSNRTDVKDGCLEDGVGGNGGQSWGQVSSELGATTVTVGGNSVGGNDDPGTWLVPIPPHAVPTTFDRFWHMYPRKAGKQAARKAFTKATKHADVEVIIAGAARFASDPNREDSFTPHPATWLNQGRWEDDPLPARSGKSQERKQQNDRVTQYAAALTERRNRKALEG